MPKGVAIPELRQQLFAAAEQVILRAGPLRLSGRSVTTEAGVASGLLYKDFANLDEFLAAYAIDRTFLLAAGAAGLPQRAGTGDIADNVCDALLSIEPVPVRALPRLLVARPDLGEPVRAVLGDTMTGLDAIRRPLARNLTEERRLGRVVATTDPEAVAHAIVAVLHHEVLTSEPQADIARRTRRTIAGLVRGVAGATRG